MDGAFSSPVIAFDFDGVIAEYNGFVAKDDIQKPNTEVVRAMKILKAKNCRVLIHSTRGDAFLKQYCEKFSIPYDYINRRPDVEGENPGKPIASVYIDDRALQYQGEDAESLVTKVANFITHWQKRM